MERVVRIEHAKLSPEPDPTSNCSRQVFNSLRELGGNDRRDLPVSGLLQLSGNETVQVNDEDGQSLPPGTSQLKPNRQGGNTFRRQQKDKCFNIECLHSNIYVVSYIKWIDLQGDSVAEKCLLDCQSNPVRFTTTFVREEARYVRSAE